MLPTLLVTLAPASAEAAAVALAPDASTCMLLAEPPDGGGGAGAAAARPALQAGTVHRLKSSALEEVAALDNLHDVVLVHDFRPARASEPCLPGAVSDSASNNNT
jgi:hypothetical protein